MRPAERDPPEKIRAALDKFMDNPRSVTLIMQVGTATCSAIGQYVDGEDVDVLHSINVYIGLNCDGPLAFFAETDVYAVNEQEMIIYI